MALSQKRGRFGWGLFLVSNDLIMREKADRHQSSDPPPEGDA